MRFTDITYNIEWPSDKTANKFFYLLPIKERNLSAVIEKNLKLTQAG